MSHDETEVEKEYETTLGHLESVLNELCPGDASAFNIIFDRASYNEKDHAVDITVVKMTNQIRMPAVIEHLNTYFRPLHAYTSDMLRINSLILHVSLKTRGTPESRPVVASKQETPPKPGNIITRGCMLGVGIGLKAMKILLTINLVAILLSVLFSTLIVCLGEDVFRSSHPFVYMVATGPIELFKDVALIVGAFLYNVAG